MLCGGFKSTADEAPASVAVDSGDEDFAGAPEEAVTPNISADSALSVEVLEAAPATAGGEGTAAASKTEADAEESSEADEGLRIMRVEYTSTLTCPNQRIEMGLIVEAASFKNRDNGIGGALTYNETNHVIKQLFEGEEDKVKALWKAIQKDARHKIDPKTVRVTYPKEMLSKEWTYGMTMVSMSTMAGILKAQKSRSADEYMGIEV